MWPIRNPTDQRLQAKRDGRLQLNSEWIFLVAAPVLWLLLYNVRFWEESAAAMWHPSGTSVLFMLSLFILVFFAQLLLLIFIPGRLLRPIASVLFVVAAFAAYFSDTYGVLIDKDMLRNVFATDTAEVAGLLTGRLFAYVLVLGVLPCVLIWRVRLPQISWKRRLGERTIVFASVLAASLAGIFMLSPAYASFFREHKPVRYLLTPANAVYGLVNLLGSESNAGKGRALIDVGAPVTRVGIGNEDPALLRISARPAARKPVVLFLVLGETARAADFQLGGYARATNPELSQEQDLIYFSNTASCGTATAISLPCIFSHAGRRDFDVDKAKRQTNLLDMLAAAGLAVQWRDNNSGCKGVCARIKTIEYGHADSARCSEATCYDEDMIAGLAEEMRNLRQDTVYVFHQAGSHGPAYSQRYPPAFEKFKPACHSSQLDQCSHEEVVNAYDNSILYTDHNLAQQIGLLRTVADKVDGLLIYASDHGESLGENSVYLHGMPYAMAPREQKEVPFLLWMSKSYEERARISQGCMRAKAANAYSHDNIFHTVMGAVGVRSPVYQPALDMLAGCEHAATIVDTFHTGRQ